MFCAKCGKELDNDAVVCPYCGVPTGNFRLGTNGEDVNVPQTNGIAIAGFVCSFLVPVLGWVFGGIGLARANKRNGIGKGFSIAAIAIASASFLLYLAAL